jgi:hypothetical protein
MAVSFDEPQVIVNTSYGETQDNSLSRMNGLICAAPVLVNFVDDVRKEGKGSKWNEWKQGEWYRLYEKGARGKFLLECTPSINGTLSRNMGEDVFNVYRLLGSMSVLVLRINPLGRNDQGQITRPTDFTTRYGTGVYTAFIGKIGVTDKGKSVLLDTESNLIDRKFSFESRTTDLDIATLRWTDLVDDLGDKGIYILNYHYDVNGKLKGEFGYSSAVYNDSTQVANLLPSTVRDEINPGARATIYEGLLDLGTYNLIFTYNNLVGYTETRDHSPVFRAKKTGVVTTVGNTDKIPAKVTIDSRDYDIVIHVNNVTKRVEKIENKPLGFEVMVNAAYDSANLTDDLRTYTSFLAGNTGGGSGPAQSQDDQALAAAAINKLVDFDEGYRLDFIFDSGTYNTNAVHSVIKSVAEKIYALGVATVNEVSAGNGNATFADAVSALPEHNSSYLYQVSPRRRIDFGGYNVNLSLGIDYLECVARNKANLQEFAPVFHFTNAFVADTNLTKYYTKSERELLLGKRVNTVKRDKFRGISFINNNFTTLNSNTSLGNEEQIVRLANRMAWDIQFLLDQFLGQLDVKATANSVKTEIQGYYKSNFSNQKYAPESMEVICDESNNRFGDGELVVTVNIYVGRALKKITVYNNILPLTSYE